FHAERGEPPGHGEGRRSATIHGALPLIANARIDDGVENVHEEVHHHDHRPAHEHGGLRHREVAEGDPLVEEPSYYRPAEHWLHHHRHVDHDDEVDAG